MTDSKLVLAQRRADAVKNRQSFLVVPGRLNECNCIHWQCPCCEKSDSSVALNRFASLPKFFSVECGETGEVYLVHFLE